MNNDLKQKEIMREKTSEFKRLFAEKYESSMCRELLGHDISKEDEDGTGVGARAFVRFLSMCCKRHNRNTGEDDIDAAYKGGTEMGISL